MVVKDLVKKYDGKPVVDSVDFELHKGKVTSLIGPNGAGKSTVMGIISRLIARDSGVVQFLGEDISKWNEKQMQKFRGEACKASCDPHADEQHSDEADGARACGVRPLPVFVGETHAAGYRDHRQSDPLYGA